MPHHTKDKGDLGVAKAHADLVMQGFMVLFPNTEHAPFDLVAYRDGKFQRVQVKYRTMRQGAVEVRFSTSWADSHGSHTRPIDKSEVDVMCIYCPDVDQCFYVIPSDFRASVSLRVVPTRNNQIANVLFASDCRKVPIETTTVAADADLQPTLWQNPA